MFKVELIVVLLIISIQGYSQDFSSFRIKEVNIISLPPDLSVGTTVTEEKIGTMMFAEKRTIMELNVKDSIASFIKKINNLEKAVGFDHIDVSICLELYFEEDDSRHYISIQPIALVGYDKVKIYWYDTRRLIKLLLPYLPVKQHWEKKLKVDYEEIRTLYNKYNKNDTTTNKK